MPDWTIQPFTRPFDLSLTPPASKSLTNRALVLAALADGASDLGNVLFADDTRVMLDGLARLGFELEIDEQARRVRVRGQAGRIPAAGAELFCGNSGTTIRFVTALCALGRGRFVLDGNARMRQRPIGQLLDMLKNLGVRSRSTMAEGCPPVELTADGLPGGRLRFGDAQSSQFLSAILMAAPYASHEVRVDLEGVQTGWPFVVMTMRLMDVFGHTPHLIRDSDGTPRCIVVPGGRYAPADYTIEPDASNASYLLAAAALHPGARITIAGLGRHSLQGDVALAEVLGRMGATVSVGNDTVALRGETALHGIDADLRDMPDMAQTLAVVALFADGPTTLRNLAHARYQETDRLAALAMELTKLGANVRTEVESISIEPPGQVRAAAVDTYDDHRMAMGFALAATRTAGVVIRDAQCVGKTYPGYFGDIERLARG